MPFSLKASKQAREKATDRILRICWETNGSVNPDLLEQMLEIAIDSGSCVKFDLKAWDPSLHIALSGVTNQRTLKTLANQCRQAAQNAGLNNVRIGNVHLLV